MSYVERPWASNCVKYDLDAAFQVEVPYEWPQYNHDLTCRAMNEDLGDLLGVEFKAWMGVRKYDFSNHLAGYRWRFGFPEVPS